MIGDECLFCMHNMVIESEREYLPNDNHPYDFHC
jgi:hypothetical protein